MPCIGFRIGIQIVYHKRAKNATSFAIVAPVGRKRLQQSHHPDHAERRQGDQRVNGDAVEHGPQTRFFEVEKACAKADRRQGGDHQELAGAFDQGAGAFGDPAHAVESGQQQKAADEPGNDLDELDLLPSACRLQLLLLCARADIGEDQDRGDNGDRARELDHGGKVACDLGEGVARGHHACRIVDRGSRPDAVGDIRHTERLSHQGIERDHDHIKEEGGGHGKGDVLVVGVDHGGNGRHGRAAANAGACRNEVAELPVQAEELADKIAAAKAHGKGKEHHEEGHFADREDRVDREGGTQKDDGDL